MRAEAGANSGETNDVEDYKASMGLRLGPSVGKGTSGEVAPVLNIIDGGRYVVKKVKVKKSGDEAALAIMQEVRLHRLCSSGCTSIVRYAFSNLSGDSLLVCMEACDLTLWEALTQASEASPRSLAVGASREQRREEKPDLRAQRLALTTELCAAVRHCHDQRVLHRDINPFNVLIVRKEGPGAKLAARLGDFGLAAPLPEGAPDFEGVEVAGGVALDASALESMYSAPELGKKYGFAADVFSLGLTLLATWAASACEDEDTLISVVESAKAAAKNGVAEQPLFEETSPTFDSKGQSLIRAMLLTDPGERPTASEVCLAFGSACDQAPVKAGPQEDIEACFQRHFGAQRLVTWQQLSMVITKCGLSEQSLAALEDMWGREVDGFVDYILFLDWLFGKNTKLAQAAEN